MRYFSLSASIGLLLIVLFITSCHTSKEIVYLQENSGADSTANFYYSPVYHMNDLLSITVSAMDAEAVKPFNRAIVAYTSDNAQASNVPMQQGYFIDTAGYISFPVIGQLKIGGLTRMQAIQMIRDELKTYVKDPMVMIKILNYKVTVLGDVKLPGTFSVSSERITLPEALGLAGDLNITGVRKNILIIRDIDGKKTEIRVDLTSKNAYNSPGYYLRQNDVVYVQPNRVRRGSSVVGTNAGILVSIASLLLTTIALLTR